MNAQESSPAGTQATGRSHLSRTLIAALIAGIISVIVLIAWRAIGWKYASEVSFGVFLFQIPVLQPASAGSEARSLPVRMAWGLLFGLVGGILRAYILSP